MWVFHVCLSLVSYCKLFSFPLVVDWMMCTLWNKLDVEHVGAG